MGRGLYMLGQGRPHKPFHRVRFSVEFSSLESHSSGVPSCETGSAVPRRLNRQSQTIREGSVENHGSNGKVFMLPRFGIIGFLDSRIAELVIWFIFSEKQESYEPIPFSTKIRRNTNKRSKRSNQYEVQTESMFTGSSCVYPCYCMPYNSKLIDGSSIEVRH